MLNISFVIPAYNAIDTIGSAIESIFDGNFQNGDELIVVDDFSTDATVDIVNTYAKKCSDIRLLRHGVRKSTAAAGRNTGIEQANNKLIFCLDSDNILPPSSIDSLKKYMISQQADAAAFGEIWYFADDIKEITHKWIFQEIISLSDALAGYYWPGPSGNYMFTREGWIKAGRYFEPSLENQSLDSWIFGIRQLGTGQKMITLPETGYYHRHGHQSHYIEHSQRGNQSLAALIGLIPFLDQIEDADIDYIFSKTGRLAWVDKLPEKPIRVKNQMPGKTGQLDELLLPDDQNKDGIPKDFAFTLKSSIRRLIKK